MRKTVQTGQTHYVCYPWDHIANQIMRILVYQFSSTNRPDLSGKRNLNITQHTLLKSCSLFCPLVSGCFCFPLLSGKCIREMAHLSRQMCRTHARIKLVTIRFQRMMKRVWPCQLNNFAIPPREYPNPHAILPPWAPHCEIISENTMALPRMVTVLDLQVSG